MVPATGGSQPTSSWRLAAVLQRFSRESSRRKRPISRRFRDRVSGFLNRVRTFDSCRGHSQASIHHVYTQWAGSRDRDRRALRVSSATHNRRPRVARAQLWRRAGAVDDDALPDNRVEPVGASRQRTYGLLVESPTSSRTAGSGASLGRPSSGSPARRREGAIRSAQTKLRAHARRRRPRPSAHRDDVGAAAPR
jgi:hypothetical protein